MVKGYSLTNYISSIIGLHALGASRTWTSLRDLLDWNDCLQTLQNSLGVVIGFLRVPGCWRGGGNVWGRYNLPRWIYPHPLHRQVVDRWVVDRCQQRWDVCPGIAGFEEELLLMEEIRLTTGNVVYPMFYRVLYILSGAGFLPSIVWCNGILFTLPI